VVPPCSDRIARVPPYSRTILRITRTGLSPTTARFSKRFRLSLDRHWPGPRDSQPSSPPACTVLSTAFRTARRLASLLPESRFASFRINASKRAAAYCPERDRTLVTTFRSPTTSPAFTGSIPGSTFLACYFAFLANLFHCPFGPSAPQPRPVRPGPGCFNASGPLQLCWLALPAASPVSTPLRDFYIPLDQSVQLGPQPLGPPSESARSPLAPRSLVLFLVMATDHRSWSATSPEACCS